MMLAATNKHLLLSLYCSRLNRFLTLLSNSCGWERCQTVSVRDGQKERQKEPLWIGDVPDGEGEYRGFASLER